MKMWRKKKMEFNEDSNSWSELVERSYMLLEIILALFRLPDDSGACVRSSQPNTRYAIWLINCYQITFEINNVRDVFDSTVSLCHTHVCMCVYGIQCASAWRAFVRFSADIGIRVKRFLRNNSGLHRSCRVHDAVCGMNRKFQWKIERTKIARCALCRMA